MKIWAKVINKEKIVKDTLAVFDIGLTEKSYERCLIEICGTLDIPTPLTLKYHYRCYNEFNRVKYKPEDFVEKVDFESFELENCIEK